MEGLICLDSSVLIEYFRKKNKARTLFPKLSLKYSGCCLNRFQNEQQKEQRDLIIAASALNHNFPLATNNEKHFNKIKGLQLITPSSFS